VRQRFDQGLHGWRFKAGHGERELVGGRRVVKGGPVVLRHKLGRL
jgi:hypothetical protein